ncbi:MAG: SRPBCC domain-containing protein [Thermoplasmata archaeon]
MGRRYLLAAGRVRDTVTKSIRQTVEFDASPREVYTALMDPKKHAAFTGAKAHIDPRVGGAFSVWDGYATGLNVRLEKDKVIVQTWRTTEFATDARDSKVTFRLSRAGQGTRLRFVHSGVPDELAEDIAQGWNEFYWTPMKAFLEKARRH